MASWAEKEIGQDTFSDSRLTNRLRVVVEALSSSPTSSVPDACGSWAATKGTYRFWSSPRVSPDGILAGHLRCTRERIAGQRRVLVVQDTTELDFTGRRGRRGKATGLGYLSDPSHFGLLVHSSLAVSLSGVPQGLVHQEMWVRDPATVGKRHSRHSRPTREKESQRWLTASEAIQASVDESTEVVIVADREADLYDLFRLPLRPGVFLLIRGRHDRRVAGESGKLVSTLRETPPCGELAVAVGREKGVASREARVVLRTTSVELRPPGGRALAKGEDPIRLQAILAEEPDAPEGETPLSWMLLTTLPVHSRADAALCVRWYALRWLIERYHYVLKSGCRVEDLQLETAERLHNAVATYCIVAWRLLWLSYQARATPEASCEGVLEREEWQTLYCVIHKTTELPDRAPPLREAVRWIAQLGGFLARKSDGEPGVKTLWTGWRRLEDMVQMWTLLQPRASPNSG